MKNKTRSIAYIPLMAVVITLCAWISIPFVIPFTLQSFGVYMTLRLLGGRNGTLSILLYILMGAVGLPVFSSFGAGIGYILGPTGGYLMGFLLCGLIYLLYENLRQKISSDLPFLLAGTATYYLCGTLWYMTVTAHNGDSIGILPAAAICILPYILPDMLKLLLAIRLSTKIKRTISYEQNS